VPDALEPFGYVSVHAPAAEAVGRWAEVVEQLDALPERVETVVVHPDTVDAAALALLRPLGRRLCFENMDCLKRDGRFPTELERVFESCPDAGFCLDVAHVLTHDPSLELASDLLDAFGDRLRQLHVSGIEPDATHRVTTTRDLARYRPVLERCRSVPLVLESLLESQP
jgi:sugar phosphate isomerase/epimerase